MTRAWRTAIRAGSLLIALGWTLAAVIIEVRAEHPFSSPAPIFIAVFGGIAVGLLWAAVGRAHRRWEFSTAPRAPGTLVSLEVADTSDGGRATCDLVIDVWTGTGAFRASTRTFINLGDLPRLVPGAAVEVAYLDGERIEYRRIVAPPAPPAPADAIEPAPEDPAPPLPT